MKAKTRTAAVSILIVCLIAMSSAQASGSSVNSQVISSFGQIDTTLRYELQVGSSSNIGLNNLLTGFQLGTGSEDFILNAQSRQLASNAKFSLIRFYDVMGSQTFPSLMPCTNFNDTSKTGTFNWATVDETVSEIFAVGAQPLITFGEIHNGALLVPPGMAINQTTGLPYPASYAAYCTDWVKHFQANGWPVKYYEIVNEPWNLFGWGTVNYTLLGYYMTLFDTVAGAMRQQQSSGLDISFDMIAYKPVLNYWLANGGANVDSINFHKYDSSQLVPRNDSEMMGLAESWYFQRNPLGYSVMQAQQMWFNTRGVMVPIICTEMNFDSKWQGGTDPRIQQMDGAVWLASVLRMEALDGVSYNIYYEFSESASWGATTQTGGDGFGMINSDNNVPWYPYYVNYMVGNNLGVGDLLKQSNCTSSDVMTLAWVHGQTLNILVICQSNQTEEVYFSGVSGMGSFEKIDSTIPWQQATVQTGTINFDSILTLNGYTVALLQKPLSS